MKLIYRRQIIFGLLIIEVMYLHYRLEQHRNACYGINVNIYLCKGLYQRD